MTPLGLTKWSPLTVNSIFSNEKYNGCESKVNVTHDELKKSRVCKEFSEEMFRNLVEELLVSPEGKITVVYKSGMKL